MQIDGEILQAIENLGPWAVFILLIMPLAGEDIIIVPAGFLVGQGHLGFWPTFVAAYCGAFVSDGAWYVLCRRYGTPLLHKRWFKRLAHPRRLLQAKHQIERKGAWLIITARLIPGSRTTAMIVAGLMHMPVWKYVLAEGSMLVLSVAFQLGLGMLIAQHVVRSNDGMKTLMALLGICIVLLGLMLVGRYLMEQKRTRKAAPRSKAAWLKRFRPPRPPGLRKPTRIKQDAVIR